ncbi:MAG: outer membrane beta-barrel protein [Bdellovibrionaceae bacterium]|nr:outer membrane beta-barrel protein [Pseudobdellovibrionaceae bacterium]
MKRILLGLLVSLLATPAFAASAGSGFHVGLSALKYDEAWSGDAYATGEQKDNRTHFDLKLGYLFSNSVYVGALYSNLSRNTTTDSPSRTATGLSVGYHAASGLYFDVNYFLQAEYNVGGNTTYKEGSGFGADFGYNIPMSSSFYLGFQLSYKSLTFKKINTISSSNTQTELAPMFNLGFVF